MGLFRSMAGVLRVHLTGPDITASLETAARAGIEILDARILNDVSVRFLLRRSQYRTLCDLCSRRGDDIRILGREGFYWIGKAMGKRPLLLCGIALLMFLTLWLPGKVLFVRVEGNQTVPVNQVLETAAECGIRFGASRREVRSERMKNALLENLPQLQWAGVNTAGCVATITVRERTESPGSAPEEKGVSSVVADCDGVILSVTVTEGSGLCSPGQAVVKGQVLISGYLDLGIAIRATRAEGEVFAATRRESAAVSPAFSLKRSEPLASQVRYSLIVGKKRINLWKGSGICDVSCGRMYEEYYVTLPGGFVLPLALTKETVFACTTETEAVSPEYGETVLRSGVRNRLLQQMISGTIRNETVSVMEADGVYVLEGTYFCTEMIGRSRQEKIGE